MKQWFITGLLLLGYLRSEGQNADLKDYGCATVTTAKEMQAVAAFLSNDISYKARTTAGSDSIPLSIHIVGKDDGSGYYKLEHLFSVICDLNTRYAPVGFYYYIQWPITYINNTNYYVHDFWGGYQMMNQYNIANTVNVYFVDDPSGACGYFSPGADGIAISKSCSNPNSTTLTHEVGHFFGLPHTFYGWENGAVPSNPENVTRGAGANCSTTGDLFCDTDADYLGSRWNCPYSGVKTDVNGDVYHPDSSLYMSYSTDICMSRFSNLQTGMMQNVLYNQRSVLLSGNPTGYATLDTPSILYPSDTVYTNNKTVRWNRVKGAEYYYVKVVSKFSTSTVRQEALTTDTSLTLTFSMYSSSPYIVTVAPLSSVNVCRDKAGSRVFSYSLSTPLSVGSTNVSQGSIAVTPNPATSSATLNLISVPKGHYQIQVININGQKLYERKIVHQDETERISLPVENYPAGMYMIRVTGDNINWTEKLMIQR